MEFLGNMLDTMTTRSTYNPDSKYVGHWETFLPFTIIRRSRKKAAPFQNLDAPFPRTGLLDLEYNIVWEERGGMGIVPF